VAKGRRRYEWAYVYGFVGPQAGEVLWLVMPAVNAGAFSLALSRFAEWVGAGEDKRVLLVLDRAGWHVAKDLEVPEGLDLEFLPARSPELQPAERLWPLVNERIANRPFEDLDELEGALVERCLALSKRPDLVRGHTRYQGGLRQRRGAEASTRNRYEPARFEAPLRLGGSVGNSNRLIVGSSRSPRGRHSPRRLGRCLIIYSLHPTCSSVKTYVLRTRSSTKRLTASAISCSKPT
jgi:hypothetical protein